MNKNNRKIWREYNYVNKILVLWLKSNVINKYNESSIKSFLYLLFSLKKLNLN